MICINSVAHYCVGLEKAHNTNGLSPLHLVVLIGSVVVLEEFLEKAPLFFSSLTRSKETVFHLAAGNKNVDGFIFMAERLGINSQKLLQQVDVNGNTVLHIAVSMACGAPVSSFQCRCQLYKPKLFLVLKLKSNCDSNEIDQLSKYDSFI